MNKKNNNKDKLIIIGGLPIMWLIYFSFEIITGRVKDAYTFFLNLLLTLVFALTGYLIYKLSNKFINGFKNILLIFFLLLLIDQGIKLIIKNYFFNDYFEIIKGFLSFDPIINTKGSWLNARFNFEVGFTPLIILNGIALFLFVELYRYYLSKNNKNYWADNAFIFITTGALCSFIDKIFYGGSLDFIGISDLFIADIKDIYINAGILFFIVLMYKSGYFSDNSSTSLKEDWNMIKEFLIFIKKDILKKIKRKV